MRATVRLVFQDCPTCKWNLPLSEIQKYADKLKLGKVEKLPFWAEGATEIIKTADKKGVTVPFFECGGKYAESLEKLAQILGGSGKKQKGKLNGDNAKAE